MSMALISVISVHFKKFLFSGIAVAVDSMLMGKTSGFSLSFTQWIFIETTMSEELFNP